MLSVNFIKLSDSGGDSQSDDLSDMIAQVDEAIARVQDQTNNDISEIIPKVDAMLVFIESAIIFFKQFSTNQDITTKLQILLEKLIQLKLSAKSNSSNKRIKRNIEEIQKNDCDRDRSRLMNILKVLENIINTKEKFISVVKIDLDYFDDFSKNAFDVLNSKQLPYLVHVIIGLEDLQMRHSILNENLGMIGEVMNQVITEFDIVCGPKSLEQPTERKLSLELILKSLNFLLAAHKVKVSLFLGGVLNLMKLFYRFQDLKEVKKRENS